MYGVTCRVTKMLDRFERRAVERLLSESGLVFEGTPDYTALAEDGDENVIATASLSGSVIKMVAASSEWRDAGLSGQVISALMNTARADGRHKFFIYTKPEAAPKFSALGFRELAASKNSVLMECGAHGVNEFRAALEAERAKNGPQAGAAVMNCNPFTLGHQFLIEEGAKQCPLFYVIVVEEDASAFPFEDRLALVREGTAHIPNVRVLTSGSYAVSKATFPTYFLKDRGELPVAAEQAELDARLFGRLFVPVAAEQAELDARLFGRLFVPALGVARRFVGTEPFCAVTALYNETLKKILPEYGCEVVEIARKESGGAPVSASRVRAMIAEGEPGLEALLPKVTLDYLKSPRGAEAAARLGRAGR